MKKYGGDNFTICSSVSMAQFTEIARTTIEIGLFNKVNRGHVGYKR